MRNRQKAKEQWAAYYKNNKAKCLATSARNKKLYMERDKQYVNEYKAKHGCLDCKQHYHPAVLEFDHLEPKKNASCSVSRLVRFGSSIKRIEEEIAKCELVCANCHRLRTISRLGV